VRSHGILFHAKFLSRSAYTTIHSHAKITDVDVESLIVTVSISELWTKQINSNNSLYHKCSDWLIDLLTCWITQRKIISKRSSSSSSSDRASERNTDGRTDRRACIVCVCVGDVRRRCQHVNWIIDAVKRLTRHLSESTMSKDVCSLA